MTVVVVVVAVRGRGLSRRRAPSFVRPATPRTRVRGGRRRRRRRGGVRRSELSEEKQYGCQHSEDLREDGTDLAASYLSDANDGSRDGGARDPVTYHLHMVVVVAALVHRRKGVIG